VCGRSGTPGGDPVTGWVYAIASEDRPLIKIGRTDRSVPGRLKELQTGQPDTLRILFEWHVQDSAAAEGAMHRALAHRHHRGEWFAVTPAEVAQAWDRCTGTASWWWQARWHSGCALRALQAAAKWVVFWTGAATWLVTAVWVVVHVAI
jgi:hypothetical protein